MKIREYCDADLAALRAMHASQGFDYEFPDLRDPIFLSKLVLEDDAGEPAMAALARLTCEMYLLVDRGSGAIERFRRVSVTRNYWLCMTPGSAIWSRGGWMMRTRGCLRRLPNDLGGG